MPPDDLPEASPPPTRVEDDGEAQRDTSGRKRRGFPSLGGRFGRIALGAGFVAFGLVLSLGLASLLGEPFREAVLVEVEAEAGDVLPSFSDAPSEAAAFFAERDTVTVTVPRDMTVDELLGLYHLENNAAARAALQAQLGVSGASDPLREGDRVTLPLTLRREAP